MTVDERVLHLAADLVAKYCCRFESALNAAKCVIKTMPDYSIRVERMDHEQIH